MFDRSELLKVKQFSEQGKLKELEDELGDALERIRNYENQMSELRFKIRDLESQLTEAEDRKEKYKAIQKEKETEVRDLQNEYANVKKQLAVVEARLADADQRHEQRLSELRKINSEVSICAGSL